ncbi:MAG: UDP-N-acetylmuramate dehydrogenase [Candidatus Geothermincolia bacterium]
MCSRDSGTAPRRRGIAVAPPDDNTISILCAVAGASVLERVPMSGLTTWKTGGPARVLIEVSSETALKEILERLAGTGTKVLTLGNGSNVLVSDAGFDGAVLRLRDELASIDLAGEKLSAGAGAMLGAATARAARACLSGLEFALGIPGTVGGAVMSNAGTYAGSTAAVASKVTALTLSGERRIFESFDGSYRAPLVPEGLVVTAATFDMAPGEPETIRAAMDEARSRREANQPLGEATAGSVFKNPPGDSAGRLIDACGLKGRAVGAASVSRVHANFIINEGGATAADIKALMEIMASEVLSGSVWTCCLRSG